MDRLPFLGFVRVTVESSARMGATTSDATRSATYRVAPWEEALLAAAAYALYRWARRRSRDGPRPEEPNDETTDSSEELMVGESPPS